MFFSSMRADLVMRTNEVRPLIDYFRNASIILGIELYAETISVRRLS